MGRVVSYIVSAQKEFQPDLIGIVQPDLLFFTMFIDVDATVFDSSGSEGLFDGLQVFQFFHTEGEMFQSDAVGIEDVIRQGLAVWEDKE